MFADFLKILCRCGGERRNQSMEWGLQNFMITKVRARGILGGAIILTLFGSFWCINALTLWPARPKWTIPLAVVAIILLLVACGLRLRASSELPSSDDPAEVAKGKRSGKMFGIIFGLESGLIGLASALLGRSGLGDWISVEVALIVGLHFLPLAYVFEMPLYFWTGGLSIAGVWGCVFIRQVGQRDLWVGLVMAAVLWSTTVFLILQTKSITNRFRPSS
jgi:hypothetical protein